MGFDPFERHKTKPEGQAEPDQIQPAVEATAVNSKPVEADKSFPVTPAIAQIGEKPPAKPARTGKSFDPFERHTDEKKSSTERRLRRALKVQPAQALLNWLIADQTRTFISARDICRGGPMQTRKLECVLDAARILVEAGWLISVETRRHDMRWWQVVRKPILCTTVAATP
jgi:hypothetical protein